MKTVAQLLRTKGHGVLSVSPEISVFEALQVMAEKNVGALLVLEGERRAAPELHHGSVVQPRPAEFASPADGSGSPSSGTGGAKEPDQRDAEREAEAIGEGVEADQGFSTPSAKPPDDRHADASQHG